MIGFILLYLYNFSEGFVPSPKTTKAIYDAIRLYSLVESSSEKTFKQRAAEAVLQTAFKIRPLYNVVKEKARSSMIKRVRTLIKVVLRRSNPPFLGE